MNNEKIIEIGKQQIDYDRHLTLFGREKADTVLYFWMKGYQYEYMARTHILSTLPTEEDIKKAGEEWKSALGQNPLRLDAHMDFQAGATWIKMLLEKKFKSLL